MDKTYSSGTGTSDPFLPGPASQEIIDMLAAAPNVLNFKPSKQARNRVWELVARENDGTLTSEEQSELDHYGHLEHIMRLVKARARKKNLNAG